jgi:hypothetical protein
VTAFFSVWLTFFSANFSPPKPVPSVWFYRGIKEQRITSGAYSQRHEARPHRHARGDIFTLFYQHRTEMLKFFKNTFENNFQFLN